ncbi:MAG: MalY/PatB family protein [Candidatus Limivivens sp.]|nr:MalY/PatB family protein [Candidatus Limivivens sp.]
MSYDFDTVIDRRGTNCLKYDFARERGKREDVLPLWVADMDFRTAPEILEKLEQTVQHGIFGYSEGKEGYFRALQNWYRDHFGWETQPEWLVKTPGVVFALAAAIRAFTKEGDAVLLQQPVYYPFSEVIRDNHRVLINSPLRQKEGHYEIDFTDLEEKIVQNHVRLFLLCSPHNPVGRVWKEWELRKIGEICLRHGVLVVSDEIHSDFTYAGIQHHVFADLEPAFADIAVTCTAPSKTFNLAGLQVSNIFISNPKLRGRFKQAIAAAGYSQVNLMGLAACQAAYEEGDPWLLELKEYLADNLAYVRTYLKEELPEIRLVEPEGTYLIWLDFRALGLTEKEREDLIVNKARLWLDSGAMFGADGEGFERINIACPRAILRRAFSQLKEAIQEEKERGYSREKSTSLSDIRI